MKRILSVMTLMVIILNMMALSVSANTNKVELTGEIMSTVIDVDIPTTASFIINPNIPEGNPGRYVMPSLNITNNTTAPVTVTMTGFDNKVGTANQFTEVARDAKVWDRLGAIGSASFIYLGMIAEDNQTAFLNHTTLLSEVTANQVQLENKELCHIKSGRTVTLDLECQSGSAFQSEVTSVYEIIFLVSLYEGIEDAQEPEEVTPSITGITSIAIDGVTDQLDFTKSATYHIYKGNPLNALFTITTSSEDVTYVANYKEYTGSQTLTINCIDGSTPGSYYVQLDHDYNGNPVTVKYVFYW
ncbi:exported protein of unknown function [Petrocella atlantisensis]|uniref:Uncharacterized protein n=1 Tax=Petrocella atlantisensis TaxID=2173034 RepID=A0A3P7PEI8_9FIRM|nr:hypothetical protein [Petrocella atlantisensis]VDN47318.1 exported protein of unknown function [Petrocella atlantisensis]